MYVCCACLAADVAAGIFSFRLAIHCFQCYFRLFSVFVEHEVLSLLDFERPDVAQPANSAEALNLNKHCTVL